MPVSVAYPTVTTLDELHELVEAYLAFDAFAFDVETIGEHRGQPRRNQVTWLSLAGPGRADVIPMGHQLGPLVEAAYKEKCAEADCPDVAGCARCSQGQRVNKNGTVSRAQVTHRIAAKFGPVPDQLTPEQAWPVLAPLFLSNRVKVGQNVKFDAMSLVKYIGRLMPGPLVDTIVMAKLLDENHRSYALGELVHRAFDYRYDKSLGKEGIDTFGFDQVAQYSYLDAKYTWLLYTGYLDELGREANGPLWDLFWDVEVPVTRVVCKMELAGATIDPEGFQRLHDDLDFRIRQLDKEIEEANGGQPLPSSGPKLIEFVYGTRGHTPTMFTDKTEAPQTGKKALEVFAYKKPKRVNPDTNEPEPNVPGNIKDPVIAAIIERASLSKLFSTYLHNNIEAVEEESKLYGEFDQLGAGTGRFSSRAPNLQNIPVRSKLGKQIRDMFIAGEGYKLIVADYSQVELRILAHLTQDPTLLRAYREGLDLHEITARTAYSIPEKDPVPSQRRSLAKNVNFSVAYGGTAWTIQTRYEVPEKDAKIVVDGFHKAYPTVAPWKRKVVKAARQKYQKREPGVRYVPPYFETLLGRRRRLPELLWGDYATTRAERQGINAIVQGTAADIAKLAMIELDTFIERGGYDWKLIMVVHDEFVVIAPEAEAEFAGQKVEEIMASVSMLSVPLEIGVTIVDRWSDSK